MAKLITFRNVQNERHKGPFINIEGFSFYKSWPGVQENRLDYDPRVRDKERHAEERRAEEKRAEEKRAEERRASGPVDSNNSTRESYPDRTYRKPNPKRPDERLIERMFPDRSIRDSIFPDRSLNDRRLIRSNDRSFMDGLFPDGSVPDWSAPDREPSRDTVFYWVFTARIFVADFAKLARSWLDMAQSPYTPNTPKGKKMLFLTDPISGKTVEYEGPTQPNLVRVIELGLNKLVEGMDNPTLDVDTQRP